MNLASSLNDLIQLSLRMANSGVVSEIGPSVMRWVFKIVMALLALGLALAAFICALAALWIYLLPLVGPIGTPLIMSGLLLLLAVLATVAARFTRTPKPVTPPVNTSGVTDLFDEATRQLKAQKIPVLIATLLAGLIAGLREK